MCVSESNEAQSDLENQKLRFLLEGLRRGSDELPYTVRLVDETRPAEPIRSVASRSSLIRLGIELANAALEADDEVILGDDLRPRTTSAEPGLLHVLLMDDKPSPRAPRRGGLGCFLAMLLAIGMLVLAGIGVMTVVEWLL